MTTWIFDSERLFWIASSAVERATMEPRMAGRRDDVIVAILFSAAAIEGFMNEFAEWADPEHFPGEPHVESYATVLTEAERQRASVTLKWQLLSLVGTGRTAPRGAQPTQDLELLFRLRNAIVHLEPERYEGDQDQHRLVRELVARSLVPRDRQAFGSWLDKISEPAVAQWAIDTAQRVVERVISDVPQGPFKAQMEHQSSRFFQR